MSKTLTEAEAWREIARRRFNDPEYDKHSGLCWSSRTLYHEGKTSLILWKIMLTRIMEHTPTYKGNPGVHAYMVRHKDYLSVRSLREASECRAWAALFFAEIAEEEPLWTKG